jgi:hypothetical protein
MLAQTCQERGLCGRNYLLELVKLCQYNNPKIKRVPAGRISTTTTTTTTHKVIGLGANKKTF